MKKVVSVLLVAVMILSIGLVATIGASAYTGDDVMNRIKDIIGDSYPAVYAQLQAVYAKVEVTDEMADQLMPLVESFATVYAKGETTDGYSKEDGQQVMDLFDQASKIVGFDYKWHNVSSIANPNLDPDIVWVEIIKDNEALGIIEAPEAANSDDKPSGGSTVNPGDNGNTGNNNSNPGNKDNVTTGEAVTTVFVLLAVLAASAGIVLVARKKATK